MVKDIQPDAESGNPWDLTESNGCLFFVADDGVHGPELWKSDGTPEGTQSVVDLLPGPDGAYPRDLIDVNGILFFTVQRSGHPAALWKSDGTAEGTALVEEIHAAYLTNVGGTLYFVGDHDDTGKELWTSDGTPGGTHIVKDIIPGPDSGVNYLTSLTDFNGTLFFGADDGVHGMELWKSDGTADGTMMVKDIRQGYPGSDSQPSNYVTIGNTMYFVARDGWDEPGTHGVELWKTDGTTAGTQLVSDIAPGTEGSYPWQLTNLNGTLIFTANDGVGGTELWKTDGSAQGTELLADLTTFYGAEVGSNPRELTTMNGMLYFTCFNWPWVGGELWKSDGTTEGTQLVKDVWPGGDCGESANPKFLVAVDGILYFEAGHPTYGRELWRSDGTPDGTLMIADFNTDGDSEPRDLIDLNGTLFFTVDYSVSPDFSDDYTDYGRELWMIDQSPVVDDTVVGDTVWVDIDGNRRQDPAEPGLADVAVEMFDADTDTLIDTVYTDSQGHYEFNTTFVGNAYLRFTPAAGYEFTPSNVDGNAFDTIDSDADPYSGLTQPFRVGPEASNTSIDAGMRPRVEVTVADVEQAFVYQVNRARNDPVGYQAERNLPIDLSYVTPRPPLAVNDRLTASAQFHADEMAQHDYFAHLSEVTGEWPNKMARDQGYALPSFYSSEVNQIESLAAGHTYGAAAAPLEGLIIDEGIDPPGHRNHLLGIGDFFATSREIGVGHAYNASTIYDHYWAIHATYSDTSDTFLTGVVYDDLNSNLRYDAGEGLGDVLAQAGPRSVRTNAAGGWAMMVGEGHYAITVSGGAFSGTAFANVTVDSDNVEVDFISNRSTGIVNFDPDAPVGPTPLGVIDFVELVDQQSTDGTSRYHLEASHDGYLTAELTGDSLPSGVGMALSTVGSTGQLDPVATGTTRVDFASADRGGQFVLEVSGLTSSADLQIVNLVHQTDASVTVFGTPADDSFTFSAAASRSIVINGIAYEFTDQEAATVTFASGEGDDVVSLRDSPGNETLTVELGSATLTNNSGAFSVNVSQFEKLHAYATAGGNDTATLYDSSGKDKFKGDPAVAKLYRHGTFYHRAKAFDVVHAISSGGGDRALLWDSPGNDTLESQRDQTRLHGAGFDITAAGFIDVYSRATNGGFDVAHLTDSPLDDTVRARSHKVIMWGDDFDDPAYKLTARRFDEAHFHAIEGGYDKAKLHDTSRDDVLEVTENWTSLSTMKSELEMLYRALAFEWIKAYSSQGHDTVDKPEVLPTPALHLAGPWVE